MISKNRANQSILNLENELMLIDVILDTISYDFLAAAQIFSSGLCMMISKAIITCSKETM